MEPRKIQFATGNAAVIGFIVNRLYAKIGIGHSVNSFNRMSYQPYTFDNG